VTLGTAYVALGSGVALWGFLVSRLRARSWETPGASGGPHEGGETTLPAGRIGLYTFFGVVTSLFALFLTAYHMRMMAGMEQGDWRHFGTPPVLWVNSAILMLASVAMQFARRAAERGERGFLKSSLAGGGLLTLLFLAGQLFAWKELRLSGLASPQNPAAAFFYLLTAVHGLHLVGGLAVWARTLAKLRHPEIRSADVALTVALASEYWHFLLLVWLVLFGFLLSM
jgi:cytochrome c oxidase subunit III